MYHALYLAIGMSVGVLYQGVPADTPDTQAVTVRLTAKGAKTAEQNGTVTLRPIMGPQAPITLPVTSFAQPLTFVVLRKSMWQVSVAIHGWWVAPSTIAVQGGDIDLPLVLLPTGTIVGNLKIPDGGAPPRELSARVDVPPGATSLPGPPSTETPCFLEAGGRFSCEVPVGTLDLSL